jgi:hypothetical protein
MAKTHRDPVCSMEVDEGTEKSPYRLGNFTEPFTFSSMKLFPSSVETVSNAEFKELYQSYRHCLRVCCK